MASKIIIRREQSFQILESTFELHLNTLEKEFTRLLAPEVRDGESIEDVCLLPKLLLRRLRRLLGRLSHANILLESFRLDRRERNRVQQEATEEVRQELMLLRRHLGNSLNESPDRILVGVPRQIPRHGAEHVLRMTDITLRMMADPDTVVTVRETHRQIYPEGFDLKSSSKPLQEKRNRLERAKNRRWQIEVLVIQAKVEKDNVLAQYNAEFYEVAMIFACLFRLAGLAELTRDLQPAGQERGLLLIEVRNRRAHLGGIRKAQEKRRTTAASPEEDGAGSSSR